MKKIIYRFLCLGLLMTDSGLLGMNAKKAERQACRDVSAKVKADIKKRVAETKRLADEAEGIADAVEEQADQVRGVGKAKNAKRGKPDHRCREYDDQTDEGRTATARHEVVEAVAQPLLETVICHGCLSLGWSQTDSEDLYLQRSGHCIGNK